MQCTVLTEHTSTSTPIVLSLACMTRPRLGNSLDPVLSQIVPHTPLPALAVGTPVLGAEDAGHAPVAVPGRDEEVAVLRRRRQLIHRRPHVLNQGLGVLSLLIRLFFGVLDTGKRCKADLGSNDGTLKSLDIECGYLFICSPSNFSKACSADWASQPWR